MKPSCVPFSGEISGSTAVIMPMPMNETELIGQHQHGRGEVGVAEA